MSLYETRRLVDEYLLFHYGSAEEILPWPFGPAEALFFPERAAQLFASERLPENPRGLDLGCAVGRSSFELSRFCGEVIGIDFSHAFIAAAQRLARGEPVEYARVDEGDCRTPLRARAPQRSRPERVRFSQGDALDLPLDLGSFDVALLANLLCRLPRPAALLERLPLLVRPGGQLAITTPGTWMEEFTPREHWLGGFLAPDGRAVPTLEELQKGLGAHFQLLEVRDLPFLIREHARKYQWSVAQATLWKRR